MQLRPIDRKRLFSTANRLFAAETVVTPTMVMANAPHPTVINYGAALHILNTLTRNGRAREIAPNQYIQTGA